MDARQRHIFIRYPVAIAHPFEALALNLAFNAISVALNKNSITLAHTHARTLREGHKHTNSREERGRAVNAFKIEIILLPIRPVAAHKCTH